MDRFACGEVVALLVELRRLAIAARRAWRASRAPWSPTALAARRCRAGRRSATRRCRRAACARSRRSTTARRPPVCGRASARRWLRRGVASRPMRRAGSGWSPCPALLVVVGCSMQSRCAHAAASPWCRSTSEPSSFTARRCRASAAIWRAPRRAPGSEPDRRRALRCRAGALSRRACISGRPRSRWRARGRPGHAVCAPPRLRRGRRSCGPYRPAATADVERVIEVAEEWGKLASRTGTPTSSTRGWRSTGER